MKNQVEEQEVNGSLAYRIYPLPKGISYYEKDLKDVKVVECLFDYAQMLEVIIVRNGWVFLIDFHGYEILFRINQKSGWFDCETVEEFKLYVEEAMNWEEIEDIKKN